MLGKKLTSLLAACIAVTAMWFVLPADRATAHAWETGLLDDSDNDFLPNCVEWAVMTNSASPDTDGDGAEDFIEVVQRGQPRHEGAPVPLDQEMRIVVTGPVAGGPQTTWMHLFFRFVGGPVVTHFDAWVDLPQYPGLRVPLMLLATGGLCVFRDRFTAQDGYWVQISAPIVSPSFLQPFLPCSFHAEAVISDRYLHTAVQVVDLQGVISTLVPFGERFAIQPIMPSPGSMTAVSNRVCLLELEEVGTGPGGTIYQVVDASCEDCNELECEASCPQSIGWILTIPGGLTAMGGG
ncbi:MAG TPA: hypothetical protein VF384_11550 [Planctomycetota bacterium]